MTSISLQMRLPLTSQSHGSILKENKCVFVTDQTTCPCALYKNGLGWVGKNGLFFSQTHLVTLYGLTRQKSFLTDSELERDMLRLHLDGLVVLAGLPQLRVGDDPEHVQRVHDVLVRAADAGGRRRQVVALLRGSMDSVNSFARYALFFPTGISETVPRYLQQVAAVRVLGNVVIIYPPYHYNT
jgi:hypothetical protein